MGLGRAVWRELRESGGPLVEDVDDTRQMSIQHVTVSRCLLNLPTQTRPE